MNKEEGQLQIFVDSRKQLPTPQDVVYSMFPPGSQEVTWARTGQNTSNAGYSGFFCFIKREIFGFFIYEALDVKIKSLFSTISIKGKGFSLSIAEVPEARLGNH